MYVQKLKSSLSINALHACVYIYNRQLSSFRTPTLWFIDLNVAICHIQYGFLNLSSIIPIFARENGQNTKNKSAIFVILSFVYIHIQICDKLNCSK